MARKGLSRRQLVKVLAASAAAGGPPLSSAEQRRYAFTQWDVFTKKPLTGNPLAVFGDARAWAASPSR